MQTPSHNEHREQEITMDVGLEDWLFDGLCEEAIACSYEQGSEDRP